MVGMAATCETPVEAVGIIVPARFILMGQLGQVSHNLLLISVVRQKDFGVFSHILFLFVGLVPTAMPKA